MKRRPHDVAFEALGISHKSIAVVVAGFDVREVATDQLAIFSTLFSNIEMAARHLRGKVERELADREPPSEEAGSH